MKYKCAMCAGEFESGWTEAEAIAEKERDFGSVPLSECDNVCDECYQQIKPHNNPDYYEHYRATVDGPIRFNAPMPSQMMLDDTEAFRAAIEAEVSRKLAEWIDQDLAAELLKN